VSTDASPPRTLSLVLGSGGARGYAHIGVIEALEASGFAIRSIAGSSMGALIGGSCACSTGRCPAAASSRAIASSAC
jgi:predicted acylesterase/phospholipase RssA